MLVLAATAAPTTSGYGLFLLETAAVLAVIALAAWAAVRLANKKFVFGPRGGRLRTLERLSLDGRSSIHLVEVDGEVLLLGVNERGVTLLKTMDTPQETGEAVRTVAEKSS